jgi:predicted transcriptional regulator
MFVYGASMTITPAQTRAARALLQWSQRDLAAHAEVGTSTVAEFESEQITPRRASLAAMRRALEQAGITFIDDDKVQGVTVPKAPAAS